MRRHTAAAAPHRAARCPARAAAARPAPAPACSCPPRSARAAPTSARSPAASRPRAAPPWRPRRLSPSTSSTLTPLPPEIGRPTAGSRSTRPSRRRRSAAEVQHQGRGADGGDQPDVVVDQEHHRAEPRRDIGDHLRGAAPPPPGRAPLPVRRGGRGSAARPAPWRSPPCGARSRRARRPSPSRGRQPDMRQRRRDLGRLLARGQVERVEERAHVVGDREVVHHLLGLERPAEPPARAPVRRQRQEVGAEGGIAHLPRRHEAGEHVEQRRLSRAVRADHPGDPVATSASGRSAPARPRRRPTGRGSLAHRRRPAAPARRRSARRCRVGAVTSACTAPRRRGGRRGRRRPRGRSGTRARRGRGARSSTCPSQE